MGCSFTPSARAAQPQRTAARSRRACRHPGVSGHAGRQEGARRPARSTAPGSGREGCLPGSGTDPHAPGWPEEDPGRPVEEPAGRQRPRETEAEGENPAVIASPAGGTEEEVQRGARRAPGARRSRCRRGRRSAAAIPGPGPGKGAPEAGPRPSSRDEKPAPKRPPEPGGIGRSQNARGSSWERGKPAQEARAPSGSPRRTAQRRRRTSESSRRRGRSGSTSRMASAAAERAARGLTGLRRIRAEATAATMRKARTAEGLSPVESTSSQRTARVAAAAAGGNRRRARKASSATATTPIWTPLMAKRCIAPALRNRCFSAGREVPAAAEHHRPVGRGQFRAWIQAPARGGVHPRSRVPRRTAEAARGRTTWPRTRPRSIRRSRPSP